MASQPRNHAQGQSLGPSPFRTIADHNPNIKRETPLLKRLLRETVKSMPSRPQTNTRRITTRRWQRVSSILRDFSDVEQLDSAVRVFSHLPSIPGLAGISPRVASQARIHLQIRLHYPGIAISRLIDRVQPHGNLVYPYGRRHNARLQVHEVQQLRDTLLNDISILCASRIAFNSDVSSLRFVRQLNPPLFRPVLDAFDLNLCNEQDADTIDWTELEKNIIRKVESQFHVFELLAQRETAAPSTFKLNPGDALHILKAYPKYDSEWCLLFQHVSKYTPELARYTLWKVEGLLCSQSKRTSLPNHALSEILTDYSKAVRHVLQLSSDENVPQNAFLISDRTFLWIVYAAILVHTHIKVVDCDDSKGVLQLDCPGPAEAYSSDEDFALVAEACREAEEAIQSLHDAGGKLKTERYFIRDALS